MPKQRGGWKGAKKPSAPAGSSKRQNVPAAESDDEMIYDEVSMLSAPA
jgi:hypothetical protein